MDQTWICDTCGELITRVEDGWIEWLTTRINGDKPPFRTRRGLRLVHHKPASPLERLDGCQYGEREVARPQEMVGDLPLRSLLGTDGLIYLLAFIYDGEFSDQSEVLEMIKRLHVPGYEHARIHFNDAISEGIFEPNTAPGYYNTFQIQEVLN